MMNMVYQKRNMTKHFGRWQDESQSSTRDTTERSLTTTHADSAERR